VPTFLCPSDDAESSTRVWLTLHTQSDYPYLNAISSPTSDPPLGRTNYVGCAGYLGTASTTAQGVFLNRSALKLGALSAADGTSNTLLFGESLGSSGVGTRGTAHSWMGAAIEVLTWGTPDPPQWYHFSSRHPGVILFALGDGAVRGVRKGYVWPD